MKPIVLAYLVIQTLVSLAEDSSERGQILALRRALVGLLALVARHPDEAIAAYCDFLLRDFAPLKSEAETEGEYAVTDSIRGKPGIVHDRQLGLLVSQADMLIAQLSLELNNQQEVES